VFTVYAFIEKIAGFFNKAQLMTLDRLAMGKCFSPLSTLSFCQCKFNSVLLAWQKVSVTGCYCLSL